MNSNSTLELTNTAAVTSSDVVADGVRRSLSGMLSGMYEMTKPGITRMVVLSASAGYFLAMPEFSAAVSLGEQILHYFLTAVGIGLTCAGSCVLNNYIERDFDKLMKRTMQRPLPAAALTPAFALFYGIALSVIGVALLLNVNGLTALLAAITFGVYVFWYTPSKRTTTLSIFIGAIPGALPPLGGWTAVTNSISLPGIVLFSILFLWQLPHFLALSWMYKKDYQRGGYEMTAVYDDTGKKVGFQMLFTSILLSCTAPLLTFTGETQWIYFFGASILGMIFTLMAAKFVVRPSHDSARRALLTSYLYLSGVIMLMFIDKM